MTLRNPNRFVTGLSDVFYVKNVQKVEVRYDDSTIPVERRVIKENVKINRHEIDTDRFVPNPLNNPSDAQ